MLFTPATSAVIARAAAVLLTAAFASALPNQALAQPAIQSNEYRVVTPAQNTDDVTKVEVLEFFSLGCNYCYAFEPLVEAWVAKQGANVTFKQIHRVDGNWQEFGRLYYTLEAMGKIKELKLKAFEAIHKDGVPLNNKKFRNEWLTKNGVDVNKFEAVSTSFSIVSRMARAEQLARAYKVEGVPTLTINGKFVINTPTGAAGGHTRMLAVADKLVAQEQKK